MSSSATIERLEVNDRGEALVSAETNGVTIVAIVPVDVSEEDLEEAVDDVPRLLSEYVPRFGGNVLEYDESEATAEDVARCYDGTAIRSGCDDE